MILHTSSQKGERNHDKWKTNEQKKLRNVGLEYVGKGGKKVPMWKIGSNCRCSTQCFHRVNEETRRLIFSKFWAISNYDVQNAYLFGCMECTKPARCYNKKQKNTGNFRRAKTWKYSVILDGRRVPVCSKAF